ncbi:MULTISPECIES: sodium-dependent transporter [unclassified Guyparkeria]|uniref:sodium-dependent transporter n=1 Tax=unclassified Guyparkeria TaxID=2626246 RepID=UPI0007334EEA|nr:MULTISPECIES: sodium-dependent transporter [unclassified Guyparkeria]KTG16499.1 transporter [Guyparkeria sp. XI15]OAE85439.1 transporter [Guyparkeria sp. WRN-7]
MSAQHLENHPEWSGRLAFILASAGSAVGLGNIWKFPYIMGENGGGAFVMIYLACLLIVATPILISEVMLGRRARSNPITGMAKLSREAGVHPGWQVIGWMGVLTGFLILSFYSVVMGWALAYVEKAADGAFVGASADTISGLFDNMVANPGTLLFWHTVAMIMTVTVVARGVRGGLELATRVMMPLLIVILVLLFGYNIGTSGFAPAMAFMFSPDFSQVSGQTVLVALGHAFFTLSLGMGAIMVYGSYMPKGTSIVRAGLWIIVLDTGIALLAGMVIFPIVFSNGMSPEQGAGLVFQTLPLALGQMEWGYWLAIVLFVLVSIAAWTSAISLVEPAVSYLWERYGIRRLHSAVAVGVATWSLGVLAALSFNLLGDVTLFGKTIFGVLEFATANILLPAGGLLIALFAAWRMRRADSRAELGLDGWRYRLWWWLAALVAPAGVALVFANGLGWLG